MPPKTVSTRGVRRHLGASGRLKGVGYAVAGQGALMLGKNLCRVGRRPKSQATTMRHDYSDPVARLLDYGGFDIRQIEEPWPDYLELGFAEEHVPELIRMATDSDLNNADQDNLEVWAPLHAWRTLGQLRAVEAAKPLVHLLEQLRHDDWLPIDLRKVFTLIGPLSVPAIAEFMANRSIEEICRVSVPACLEQIAHDYPDHRNECVGVLAHQLSFYATNGTDLNAFLVMSLANLKASETIDLIRKAFAADCVELTLQGTLKTWKSRWGLGQSVTRRHRTCRCFQGFHVSI